MKSGNYAVITMTAIATLLLVISTVSTITPESVFAYQKNQAASHTSACGNGEIATNVGCQNTDSQTQGDENAVGLTTQQTFPEIVEEEPPITPEPQTCEECFTQLLTAKQLETFEEELRCCSAPNINSIEDLCGALLNQQATLDDILGLLEVSEIDSETNDQIIECLKRVLGLQTNSEPLES